MRQAAPFRSLSAAAVAPAADALSADRDAAFRAAQRHSRRVRFLRRALPTAAIVSLLIVGFVVWLDPLRFYRGGSIEFGRLSIVGNKLTIEAPKLTGFTQDQRPYSVTAQSAAQDLSQPNLVELSDVHAQVELTGRGETEMHAKVGLYDIKAGNLQLTGGIEIRSTGGYRVNLSDAFVEVRKGHMVTNSAVHAVFPNGSLQAGRLEIFEHGARVLFDSGISMTLRLPPPADAATAEASR